MKVKWRYLVAQSINSLQPHGLQPLPGSSVHGISQARIPAISFSRGSSWPRDQTRVSCIAGKFFTVWATREAIYLWYSKPYSFCFTIFWFASPDGLKNVLWKESQAHPVILPDAGGDGRSGIWYRTKASQKERLWWASLLRDSRETCYCTTLWSVFWGH